LKQNLARLEKFKQNLARLEKFKQNLARLEKGYKLISYTAETASRKTGHGPRAPQQTLSSFNHAQHQWRSKGEGGTHPGRTSTLLKMHF